MKVIRKGDTGPEVTKAQELLNAAGFPVIAVDGIFGNNTDAQTRALQAAKGLVVDGIIGGATWAVLLQSAPIPKPTPSGLLHGVDVSAYDPGIDWGRVASAGIDFAFIKATEGYSFKSALFDHDWKYSKGAGILRGAYHFFRPQDTGAGQAKHFLNVVGPRDDMNLGAIIDFEVADGVPAATQKARALEFCQALEAAGWPVIFYTYPGFADSVGDLSAFKKYPLWIAHYGVTKPRWPHSWADWTFWQNSDHGKVDGIKQACDTNIFRGSLADLQMFAARKVS